MQCISAAIEFGYSQSKNMGFNRQILYYALAKKEFKRFHSFSTVRLWSSGMIRPSQDRLFFCEKKMRSDRKENVFAEKGRDSGPIPDSRTQV